jgi:hypothetical protein
LDLQNLIEDGDAQNFLGAVLVKCLRGFSGSRKSLARNNLKTVVNGSILQSPFDFQSISPLFDAYVTRFEIVIIAA